MTTNPTNKEEKFVTCPRCKGKGFVRMVIKPPHSETDPDDLHMHIVPCPQPYCIKGKVDREAYYESFKLPNGHTS